MEKDTRLLSKIAAAILIGTNFLFMTLSAVVFTLGLWIIASPSSLSFGIQSFGPMTLKALFPRDSLDVQFGALLAFFAMFYFSIALMGFYGALKPSKFLLFMYAVLVILLLLLECALLFYYSSNLLEKGLQPGEGPVMHGLRVSLHCCERNYTMESLRSNSEEQIIPPWSCCGGHTYPNNCTADKTFQENCQDAIISWLNRYQIIIYLTLVALHVLLASCSLIRRSGSLSFSHR